MADERIGADGKRVGKRAENGGNPTRGLAEAAQQARDKAPEDATGNELDKAAIAIWLKGYDAAEAWGVVRGEGE